MSRAIEHAGLQPGDIDYVNAHGTASPAGDRTEARALREAFGRAARRPWVNATKGLTGHCLWSAGVLEAVAAVIQMRSGFVHPNVGLQRPIDPEIRFVGNTAEPAEIRRVLAPAISGNTDERVRRVVGADCDWPR